MTELLLFLTGTATGAAAVHAIWRHHAELHHWDRYRVEAGRFDVLCHDNDLYDPDDVEPCGGSPWWRERDL